MKKNTWETWLKLFELAKWCKVALRSLIVNNCPRVVRVEGKSEVCWSWSLGDFLVLEENFMDFDGKWVVEEEEAEIVDEDEWPRNGIPKPTADIDDISIFFRTGPFFQTAKTNSKFNFKRWLACKYRPFEFSCLKLLSDVIMTIF